MWGGLGEGGYPAFIHYNGNSKAVWPEALGLSPGALSSALKARYVARTSDAELRRLDGWLRDHVSFLDPEFEKDASVTFADVCAAGAI